MMDLTSAIQGLSFTTADLLTQIGDTGWSVTKCKYDKQKDKFTVEAQAPHKEKIQTWGKTERLALSAMLVQCSRLNHSRSSRIAMWTSNFVTELQPIAEAYSTAPVYDTKAAIAFMQLAHDCERRAKALMEHLDIQIVNNPEPYKSAEKMSDDIRKRRQLQISRAGIQHPIWSEQQVIAFRIVSDILGYAASGGGFDWQGTNQAFSALASILPFEAQKALFSEMIAPAAYAAYYRSYGPQKVALFPKFMDQIQDKENPHKGFPGVHPSQMIPPVEHPHLKPPKIGNLSDDLDYVLGPKVSQNRLGEVSEGVLDPNAGYQSNVDPLPQNAMLDHGDPLDYAGGTGALATNAALINTGWELMNQEDPGELATMKQAIINAFRVALLSPQKDLKWNAAHYQDIAEVPANQADPLEYYKVLEKKRQEFNMANGFDRFSHMPFKQEATVLATIMHQQHPELPFSEADDRATRFIQERMAEAVDQIEQEEDAADVKPEKRMDLFALELEANKRVGKLIHQLIQPSISGMDHESAKPKVKVNPEQQGMDLNVPIAPPPQLREKYGGIMYGQLRAIAQISERVDDILKAALEDVAQGGQGWRFRSEVMRMQMPGVGPKVCSFAWLLLQPLTSQLATIDTHMMALLGQKRGTAPPPRDYFKLERQFRGRMDAAGYGGAPLGMLQWGMWDATRTGLGTHQDHSPLKVLNPKGWRDNDWHEQASDQAGVALTPQTDWWKNTQPVGDQIGDQTDQMVKQLKIPDNQIPFNNYAPPQTYLSKVAASMLAPRIQHPTTGEWITGPAGMTLMQHARNSLGLSTPQVWQQLQDEMVGKG